MKNVTAPVPLKPSGSIDSRVVLAEPLNFLEDVLWEWIAIQERSIRIWGGKDAMWWYGERTSVGGFAGAIWRAGGIVLEEYSTEKYWDNRRDRKRGKKRNGRGDMDFELGGRKYTIEAKHCWPRLGTNRPSSRLEDAKEAAMADAAGRTVERGYTKLAVVFAAPSSLKPKSLEEDIGNWVGTIPVSNAWAQAWVFPKLGQKVFWKRTGRYFPGAAIFVKRIGRGGPTI